MNSGLQKLGTSNVNEQGFHCRADRTSSHAALASPPALDKAQVLRTVLSGGACSSPEHWQACLYRAQQGVRTLRGRHWVIVARKLQEVPWAEVLGPERFRSYQRVGAREHFPLHSVPEGDDAKHNKLLVGTHNHGKWIFLKLLKLLSLATFYVFINPIAQIFRQWTRFVNLCSQNNVFSTGAEIFISIDRVLLLILSGFKFHCSFVTYS